MEKRLFLSLVLSFGVLYLWSVMTPSSQKILPETISEQTTEPAGDIKDTKLMFSDAKGGGREKVLDDLEQRNIEADMALERNEEEIYSAETDKIEAEFSTLGGVLKGITIKSFDHKLPLEDFLAISGYENVVFDLDEATRNFISFSYKSDKIEIKKRYRLLENEYFVQSEIEVTNFGEMSKKADFSIKNFYINTNGDSAKGAQHARASMLMEYSIAKDGEILRKKGLSKISKKHNVREEANVWWTGFRDQYFCAIVKNEYKVDKYVVERLGEKSLSVGVFPANFRIEPGHKKVLSSKIYYGPQDLKTLKRVDEDFGRIINFKLGNFFDVMAFGLTDTIAKGLLSIMNLIYKLLPNWGVAIILIAFLVYGVTYPLTHKSMVAMRAAGKKMQSLQPELTKIKERHKNNPQKLNQEMMLLYKKHDVSPFSMLGGCLPMLLQMPIMVSLYQLLWRNYSFKGASFLWIKDLSEPDRLFTFAFTIPYVGNEFNILPLVYGGLMFLQQKFQAKNMPPTDPTQAETQKMMAKMMPIMLCVLFYKFASGLTLYFVIYYVFTTFSQWQLSKNNKGQ